MVWNRDGYLQHEILRGDLIVLEDRVTVVPPRRKLVTIAKPDDAARGVAPVGQHHRCDESKILSHKKLGIEVD